MPTELDEVLKWKKLRTSKKVDKWVSGENWVTRWSDDFHLYCGIHGKPFTLDFDHVPTNEDVAMAKAEICEMQQGGGGA